MKYISLFTVLLILCLAAGAFGGDRVGSSFGYMTTADARGQGVGSVSLGAGLADMTSVVGVFHYGLSRFTDGSIKLGLVDDDDPADTRFSIGADFQYQLLAMGDVSPKPFDLALGGLFEFTSFDNVSVGKYKLTGKGGGTTYHPDIARWYQADPVWPFQRADRVLEL
ncbi:MAG: hypothetical protein ACE5FH_10015 [Candidatus Zixiibacteriota bacterium]